jgi:hypothetical protein
LHYLSVFISHSWAYSGHYETLAHWIFEKRWNVAGVPIHFEDHSVPKTDPIHYAPSEADLRAAIYERIGSSNVVVIPTGMYANHSGWIQKEIDGAIQYRKHIIAVNPWTQERKSSIVSGVSSEIVGWNKQSVISAIWRHRHGH